MRIIGGDLRSRLIKGPPSSLARPTRDRVREAVFNMVGGQCRGARVLDLFAGTGAYGLESLSRGAESCVFVEKDPVCSGIIEVNISALGVSERSKLEKSSAEKYLSSLAGKHVKYDMIFMDPPYGFYAVKNILIMVERYDILSASGMLIAEHGARESAPGSEGAISIYKQKSYGITSVSIYIKK